MAFVEALVRHSVRPAGPVGVLIVDADPGQRRSLAGMIAAGANGRFHARVCASPEEARAAIRDVPEAIIIADIETIGGLARLHEMARPASPLIATSASASLSTAVAAMKGGASDFIAKPIGAKALMERLEAAVASWQPGTSKTITTAKAAANTDFAGFIGRSPVMHAVYEQIKRMAPSRAPVFVTGESGTGKELAAEAVHEFAGAQGRPFVAINCSAIPKELMESEIFGHVRGAFTGAAGDRAGAAEIADGGTLFLDEIADMDLGLQAKLLRFLQTGSFRRIGGNEVKGVTVRIVSATNRDPFAEVEAGRFRADLLYRLHVLPIDLPPLRERRDDIPLLAEAFLTRFSIEEGRTFTGFDRNAAAMLETYDWPGNVRQLANVIRRAVVLDAGGAVTSAMLPDSIRRGSTFQGRLVSDLSPHGAVPPSVEPYWRQERTIIETAVAACSGNVARAAAALEISPATIYRKRQAWAGRDTVGG